MIDNDGINYTTELHDTAQHHEKYIPRCGGSNRSNKLHTTDFSTNME